MTFVKQTHCFGSFDEGLKNNLMNLIYSKIVMPFEIYKEKEIIVGNNNANEGGNGRVANNHVQ